MSIPAPQFATAAPFPPAEAVGATFRPLAVDGQAAWLHMPPGPTQREAGVVLVVPPGRDGRCAYRPLHDLAEAMGEAGFPTLRVEPLGAGDSEDGAPDQDLWPCWLEGVKAAVEALKREAGVRNVVVGGIRLGATIAASSEVKADGWLLMAPVASGRQWLRELKLAASMSHTGGPEDSTALESEGLHLNPATAASIAKVDLRSLEHGAGQTLVLVGGARSGGVAERLAELGCDVRQGELAGYEDLFEDTHSNQAPAETFAAVVGWLEDAFPRRVSQEVGHLSLYAAPAVLRPEGCLERPVLFGHDLAGVFCTPREPSADPRAVIFCSTSGEPRAGVGRFAATASRELARRGVAALRFDFPGIGDSAGDRGHVYETSRAEDFAAAVDFLAADGYRQITLVGICSGSYHTIRALIADARVSGAFLVSPKLVWRKGECLTPEFRDQGKATSAYMSGLGQAANWSRLLKGEIDVTSVARTVFKRLGARLGAQLNDEGGRDLREGVAAVAARGGRMHALLGLKDASMDEVETYFGRGGAKLTALPGMSLHVEPELEHGLSVHSSREVALADLLAFVGA